MHTVVISEFQALLNLKKAWLALMEQSAWCSVFSSPEWNYSWWRVYGNGKQLCVWTLWSSPENLAGIYPLFMEKKQGVRWLCPLGYPRHADTSGLVADSTRTMDVHAAFFSWLGSQGGWDVARLSNVPVESLPDQQSSAMWQGTTEDVWSGFARKAGLKSKTVPAEPCMIIPLRDSNFMDDRPGKVEFHTCKRKLKELNRHFRDATVNHTPLDQACIDEVVKLSTEKSKAYREGKSFFNAPGAETFMRDMAGHEQQSFSLRLFTLHLNERLAAFELTYVWRNSLLVYARGFDHDFAKYSPGMYLLCNLINSSFDSKKICCVNMLLGGEAYKDAFSPITSEQKTYTFINKTAFAYFYMLNTCIRNAIKKVFKSLIKKQNH